MPLIPKHPRIAPTSPPFDDDTRAALDILGPPIALFVIAHYTAAAGAADAVGATARQARGCLTRRAGLPAGRRPPGHRHGIDNPDEFALVERDESHAAFAEHRRTPHLRRDVETELVALLTARSRRCPGQLCDATYDVLTPRSRDRSRRADMNA
jgi:quinol monooxygenase YgiN